MNRHRCILLLGALLLAVVVAGAVAAPAAGATPDPAAAASAYLQARDAAVMAGDPAALLAPWLQAGSRLAATECSIARGVARRAATLGHILDGVTTDVEIGRVIDDRATGTATVSAHAVTTLRWHAASGATSTEAGGVDHTLQLRLAGDEWRIVAEPMTTSSCPRISRRPTRPPVAYARRRRIWSARRSP